MLMCPRATSSLLAPGAGAEAGVGVEATVGAGADLILEGVLAGAGVAVGAGEVPPSGVGAGGIPDPLPATSIHLSTSSCDALISKFTCGCSKSGTFKVPLISAAVARSATNCASSFPPESVNLPVRNAMGSFQPLRESVTLDRLDSACQSCMRIGLMAKLCRVTPMPLISARGAAAPLMTLPSTTSGPVRLMLSI